MPRDEKHKLKNRRARLDEAIEGNPKSRKLVEDAKPEKKDDEDSYERDFDIEADIVILKDRKKELLKQFSGTKGAKRKELLDQLKELNEEIMDLENE